MKSKKKSPKNQPKIKDILAYLEEQTITVDGLKFETLIFPNLLSASSQKEDIRGEIFGVRLTNWGEKPYRFIFYCLFPQVFDENKELYLRFFSRFLRARKLINKILKW